MIEYKTPDFYNEYLGRLHDFKLLEPVKASDDNEKKNLLIGEIEAIGTCHPLKLRVEIPVTFPHHGLKFWTNSLEGYPHLIYNGSKKHEGWLCLNTPFAETAEEQLNQEFTRLRQWIAREVLSSRPAVIKDTQFVRALRIADAYGPWENVDEMDEFADRDAVLTFVLFGKYATDFEKQMGHLHCYRNGSNRFFAFKHKGNTSFELPYIIVDEAPKTYEFLAMKDQYKWSNEVCEHLLPEFGTSTDPSVGNSSFSGFELHEDDEEKAIKHVEDAVAKLKFPEQYKLLIEKEVQNEIDSIHKDHGFRIDMNMPLLQWREDMTPEEEEEYERLQAEEDYCIYQQELFDYQLFYFALGLRHKDRIYWSVISTQRFQKKYKELGTFNIGYRSIHLQQLTSINLFKDVAIIKNENQYWGRGSFAETLIDKRIALIGCGAIGSLIAETLARSGVRKLGLWDNDSVIPGNICRSVYDTTNVGDSKVLSLSQKIKLINPLCEVETHGYWTGLLNGHFVEYARDKGFPMTFVGGDFYPKINYDSQTDVIKQLETYDIIIDCTANNELLHFLSYSVADKPLYSLCITNRAQNLLCLTNSDGNIFELRKHYLSKIEQDTQNFYHEGGGCYSPTFLATHSDINALVSLAAREINKCAEAGMPMHSTVWSYDDRGIIADRLKNYTLDDGSIRLTISSETLKDVEEMDDLEAGAIGYLLGGYNREGTQIMLTHAIEANDACSSLDAAYRTSKGIIDYIGDFCYSGAEAGSYDESLVDILAVKAADESVNTNNPLLALRNPDGSISFFLYMDGELLPFHSED